MFVGCQQFKQHIVLGTHAHNLSDRLHVIEYVNAKRFCLAISWLEQPSEHTYSCCFAGSVVTKQHEDLVRIHLQVDTVDSFEPVVVLFEQISNFEYFALLLLH